jgi:hypothetical protein
MRRTLNRVALITMFINILLVGRLRADDKNQSEGFCKNGDALVVGTGDPTHDIPAVQAAVDQGGRVCLRGSFSFDSVPALDPTIHVKKEVVISGAAGDEGSMATIVGGTRPFIVEAPGARFTIQGLRFEDIVKDAVQVRAVHGLVVANCVIVHVQPGVFPAEPGFKTGVGILVFPTSPGDVSGSISITDNKMDVGGTDQDRSGGVFIFSAGQSPNNEVDIHVAGNEIMNTVAHGIDMRDIGGRALLDRNAITTGATGGRGGGPTALVNGIRCLGGGSYTVAHNTIDTAFGNAAGIRIQSRNNARPVAHAVVFDNDITMSAAAGTVFGTESAAIEIRGAANDNVVAHNTIHGSARFALSVVPESPYIPSNNAFVMNEQPDFAASIADVFVGPGVMNTIIIGPQVTIVDQGVGTVFIPVNESHEQRARLGNKSSESAGRTRDRF